MDDFFFNKSLTGKLVNPEIIYVNKCELKILLIADSLVTFNAQDPDANWNLKVFTDSLKTNLPPWVSLKIDMANVQTPLQPETTIEGEDAVMLNFDLAKADLSQYESIWLFGAEYTFAEDPSYLGADGLRALTDFMDNGGGVFATGDHMNLGAALAGHVPRVRTMRRWFLDSPYGQDPAPDINIDPINTLVDTPYGQESTHDDIYPQVIAPKLYSNQAPYFMNLGVSYPHPVLCGKNGIIRHLPDHMHEGICEVPPLMNLTYTGADGNQRPEYPLNSIGIQEEPEVIAMGSIRDTPGEKSGLIAVYDGHRTKCGRVLVDSTWHHFFDENIKLFDINYENIKASLEVGHPVPDVRLKAYHQFGEIKDYYHNILFYLCRKPTQDRLKARGLLAAAHLYDVVIAFDLTSSATSLIFAGAGSKAKDALHQLAPQCEVSIFASMYLDGLKAKKWFANPNSQDGEKSKSSDNFRWIDGKYLENVAFGGALFGILETYHPKKIKPGTIVDTKTIAVASQKGAARALTILQAEMEKSLAVLKDGFGRE